MILRYLSQKIDDQVENTCFQGQGYGLKFVMENYKFLKSVSEIISNQYHNHQPTSDYKYYQLLYYLSGEKKKLVQ